MDKGRGYLPTLVALAALLLRGRRRSSVPRRQPRPARAPRRSAPALPDASGAVEDPPRPEAAPAGPPGPLIRLPDALAMSLRNVQTVQANVAVRTATVARFEALKAFIPLTFLPTFAVGFSRLTGQLTNPSIIFPDVTGGTPFAAAARPGLCEYQSIQHLPASGPFRADHGAADRRGGDPGQGAAGTVGPAVAGGAGGPAVLRGEAGPVPPEGRRRRRRPGRGLRRLFRAEAPRAAGARRRGQPGAGGRGPIPGPAVEHREGCLDHPASAGRRRAPVPAAGAPRGGAAPIESEWRFAFDLDSPDTVDLRLVPDFPCSRSRPSSGRVEQRLEVRLMIVGTRMARAPEQAGQAPPVRDGRPPAQPVLQEHVAEQRRRRARPALRGVYDLPVTNVGLWSRLRQAKLDVMLSQIELDTRCSRPPRTPAHRGTAGSRPSASGNRARPSTASGSSTATGCGGSTRRSRSSGWTSAPPRSPCSRPTPIVGRPGITSSSPGSTSSAPPNSCSTISRRPGSPPCLASMIIVTTRPRVRVSSAGWPAAVRPGRPIT